MAWRIPTCGFPSSPGPTRKKEKTRTTRRRRPRNECCSWASPWKSTARHGTHGWATARPSSCWAKKRCRQSTTVVVTSSEKSATDKSEKTVEHKLHIGAEVKDAKGARYARLDGNPAVAVLDARVVAELQRTPLDFVNRAVLKLDPTKATGLTR